MKIISLKRTLAYIRCGFHCLTHMHRSCVHGKGRMLFGFLVWDEIDAVWCYDCKKVYYDERDFID